MEQEQDNQRAENLERVIEKNLRYIDTVVEDLLTVCMGARTLQAFPRSMIENVLNEHGRMRARHAEIEKVRAFLLRKYNRRIHDDPSRLKMMADLDVEIAALSARQKTGAPTAPKQAAAGPPTASERWLRIDDNSLSFTINARLLDELEYEPLRPGESPRVTQQAGRGFTLFTLRGPASALDEITPCFKLRQHDIIERFSATEIRGVLTHLRKTSLDDIRHVFYRLITCRFTDVKCVLVGLHTPDQLDEHFLKYLDITAEEMHAGQIRTIDIADHR